MNMDWNAAGVRWLSGREEAELAFDALSSLAELVEASVRNDEGASGFCRGCRRWGRWHQPGCAPGEWANTMEGLICECGLNGRMRGILAALDALLDIHGDEISRAAVFERVTPMFPRLADRLPGLQGSEYLGDDFAGGDVAQAMGHEVHHESLLAPSFESESLDLVMHFDVLEHVPGPINALQQCHRVLRSGGWLLFSTPFYEQLDRSIVRARLGETGVIYEHPACYHGSPVDGGGALVFTQFGWDLLDDVRNSGFVDVGMLLCFNPVEGVLSDGCPFPDGHAWPLVFAARKPLALAGDPPSTHFHSNF